jgi:hypothetical protein
MKGKQISGDETIERSHADSLWRSDANASGGKAELGRSKELTRAHATEVSGVGRCGQVLLL